MAYLSNRVRVVDLGANRNEVSQKLVGDLARSEIRSPKQRGMNSKDILGNVLDLFSLDVLQFAVGDFRLVDNSRGLLRVGQEQLKGGPSSKSEPCGKL